MENICVITDFEEVSSGKKFTKLQMPENLTDYALYTGGNFYFITNNKMTVRFHEAKCGTEVPQNVMENWVKKLKSMYPKF